MREGPRSVRASKASLVSKKLVGSSIAQAKKRSRSLTSQEAYELLEQHCRGMWSDGDDQEPAEKAEHIPEARHSDPETASHCECSKNGKGSDFNCSLRDSSKAARNKRREISMTKESCAPANSRSAENVVVEDSLHVVRRTEHTGGAPAAGDVCGQGINQKRKTQSRRQAKGVRRWSAMRSRAAPSSIFEVAASNERAELPAAHPLSLAGSPSNSLKFLEELSGLASSSQGRSSDFPLKADAQGKANERNPDRSVEDNSQRIFDETVREIRNMVYPHLDRVQRRQFVTTALRALGFASTKTQKMPLPELLARKRAEAAAVKARQAEEKLFGVRSHIDDKGSVQQAARSRAKLNAQKQRRKHLRDTFKHAGKYTGKRNTCGSRPSPAASGPKGFQQETTRRADALMAEDAGEEKLREIEAELEALSEKFRTLNNSGELSDAVSTQQQRLIRRAIEALALHLQRLSRPSSFSFKRQAAPLGSKASLTPSGDVNKAKTSADNLSFAPEEEGKLAASPPSNVLSISGLANAVLLVGPGAARGYCGCLVQRGYKVASNVFSPLTLNSCGYTTLLMTSGAVFAASVCFLKPEELDGQAEGNVPVVASACWRLMGVPLGFSAAALVQHSTAAAAADAVAALSLKEIQT
ncbi:hypothetical protein Emag_003125 [Eimeria magna]